jgi:hypothetical protein
MHAQSTVFSLPMAGRIDGAPTVASAIETLRRDAQREVIYDERGKLLSGPRYALRRDGYKQHDYGTIVPVFKAGGWYLRCGGCGRESILQATTSKMHCKSWSLPAVETCPGMVIGKGAVCGTTRDRMNCYATSGCYQWDCTIHAQWARYMWTLQCLETAEGRDEWVRIVTDSIGRATRKRDKWGLRRYRFMDSGDIFSAELARMIGRVIANLPGVYFWSPNRTYRLGVKHPAMLAALQQTAAYGSHALRPSALFIDTPPPVVPGLAAGTTVLATVNRMKGVYRCPALDGDGTCASCVTPQGKPLFICFTRPDIAVGFPLHRNGKHGAAALAH